MQICIISLRSLKEWFYLSLLAYFELWIHNIAWATPKFIISLHAWNYCFGISIDQIIRWHKILYVEYCMEFKLILSFHIDGIIRLSFTYFFIIWSCVTENQYHYFTISLEMGHLKFQWCIMHDLIFESPCFPYRFSTFFPLWNYNFSIKHFVMWETE